MGSRGGRRRFWHSQTGAISPFLPEIGIAAQYLVWGQCHFRSDLNCHRSRQLVADQARLARVAAEKAPSVTYESKNHWNIQLEWARGRVGMSRTRCKSVGNSSNLNRKI